MPPGEKPPETKPQENFPRKNVPKKIALPLPPNLAWL